MNGDASARNELIEANLPSVQVLVDQFCSKRYAEHLRDDLTSVGHLALVEAAEALKQKTSIAEDATDFLFLSIRNGITNFLLEDPTIGPSAATAKQFLADVGSLALVAPRRAPLHDVHCPSNQASLELREALDACCRDDRDKQVISLLATGLTQSEVAKEIGVSERTVRSVKNYVAEQYALAV